MIIDIRHPDYKDMIADWEKYQLTLDGGNTFVDKYVRKFSTRETETDFKNRKSYSYCAAFAKGAIFEVKNSIFQRINAVTREGGTESYKEAVAGKQGGVDLAGASMNAFIGRDILPQLLSKAKVGVYLDMPAINTLTKAGQKSKRPYVYTYKAEDILSWVIEFDESGYLFTKLLLRDYVYGTDDTSGLPEETIERYRFYNVIDGQVTVKFYDVDGVQVDLENQPTNVSTVLDIPAIPFAVAGLTDSLMTDIADYQIAQTNLASSDVSYALRANFPFYVEQIDMRTEASYLRKHDGVADNTEAKSEIATNNQKNIGVSDGRQYTKGTDQPAFIHPSSEPLEISMKKQEAMKQDIRQLVHLALTNVEPKMASAESKEQDNQGLEAGLSYIGLELETFERQIARYWMMYEGSKSEVTIAYPRRYSLKSDDELRKEAKEMKDLLHSTPSETFKKELSKNIATTLLSNKIISSKLDKIHKEIDSAPIIDTDPEIINKDVETALVSSEDASKARGYPAGSHEKAKVEHAERIARIKEAQADGDPDSKDAPNQEAKMQKEASRNSDLDDQAKDKTRGNAK